MASANEPIFMPEQIVIPENLAEVLKLYTKAAIRANPPDLLTWSQTYFEGRVAEETGGEAKESKGD